MKLLIVQLSYFSIFNALLSNTLCLCSSLSMRDQASCPHKTPGKIIIHYVLICKFLCNEGEHERFWTK